MAVKKGTSVPAKAGMKDQTSSNIARDGAAKRPQTSFADHPNMRSRIGSVQGVNGKGTGPDAGSPDPSDPSKPRGKSFGPVPAKWNMKDANGQSVNGELGQRILREGALTGR